MALSLATVAQPAHATDMYRWVDEAGRTHVSDVVPERYKKSAKRMDSKQWDVTPAQREEADRAAVKQKAAADDAASQRATRPAAPPAPAASEPAPPKRPAQSVTDSTDCTTWRRLYEESMACFGPYRTATGGTKAEAFERCNPIPSPDLKCGPERR